MNKLKPFAVLAGAAVGFIIAFAFFFRPESDAWPLVIGPVVGAFVVNWVWEYSD